MNLIYTFLVQLAWGLLKLTPPFNTKLKLFVRGRKNVFPQLESKISGDDTIIWIHAASLGEFEQGLPVLEQLKSNYPSHKFLLTFFSPSGYEVKKDSGVADIITYLPMDTLSNAKKFIKIVNPQLALFVKYEVWPNLLRELNRNQIPTILVSALFKKNQVYFKWYGAFMRNSLKRFNKIFVQNSDSKTLLDNIGIRDSEVSGDTRFDRVSEILERDNALPFMEHFKGNRTCIVAGSTWPEDEAVLMNFINQSNNLKFIIAPHNIKGKHIAHLQKSLQKKATTYSTYHDQDLSRYEVLIIDTIGLLTKIYSYADIAYVGGGFKTGLHNTLEPAVFGIPVIIGPNYSGFAEAEQLVAKGGILSVKDNSGLEQTMQNLLSDTAMREKTGNINADFIQMQQGATEKILGYLKKVL